MLFYMKRKIKMENFYSAQVVSIENIFNKLLFLDNNLIKLL